MMWRDGQPRPSADYRFDGARDVKKEVIQKAVIETALRLE